MEIDYVLVGRRIKRIRRYKGITQEDLAFSVGTSAAYISSIECAKKKPSLQKLYEIAEVLGVTINDLVYDYPDEFLALEKREITDMITLCAPENRKLLLNSISSIIQTFIT